MPADRPRARSARPRSEGSGSRARFEAIHQTIRERICLLEYPPGTHIGEAGLAGEFGVSRTPIRRVLAVLESEGLVESRHGVATVVTTIDLADLREIYALRTRLAEMIGDFDPQPRSAADMARLEALKARCEAMREGVPDAAAYSRLNMAFALELLEVIGNRALREVSGRLYFQTSRFVLETMASMDLAEEIEIFRTEITEIISALARGDFRAVGFIRRNHIAWSFDRMTEQRRRLTQAQEDGA